MLLGRRSASRSEVKEGAGRPPSKLMAVVEENRCAFASSTSSVAVRRLIHTVERFPLSVREAVGVAAGKRDIQRCLHAKVVVDRFAGVRGMKQGTARLEIEGEEATASAFKPVPSSSHAPSACQHILLCPKFPSTYSKKGWPRLLSLLSGSSIYRD